MNTLRRNIAKMVNNVNFHYSIPTVLFALFLSMAILDPGALANFTENSSYYYSKEPSPDLNSFDSSEIRLTIIPHALENLGQQISFKIDTISLDLRNLQIPENAIDICITSVEIKNVGSSKIMGYFEENQKIIDTPICSLLKSPLLIYDLYGKLLLGDKEQKICMDCSSFQVNDGQRIYYSEHAPLWVESHLENDPFMFPFDGFRITVGALMTINFMDGSGNSISSMPSIPNLYLSIDGGKQWFTQPDNYLKENFWARFNDPHATGNQYLSLLTNTTSDPLSIRFSRPLLPKVALFVFVVAFFLTITLVTLIKDIKTLSNSGIAILGGIFGARTFLVPDYIKTTGLIDLLFLTLILFYFISLIFIIAVSMSGKSKQFHTHHQETVAKKKNNNI